MAEYDQLRGQAEALAKERDALFAAWTLALGDRSAAIGKGDAKAAAAAESQIAAKRTALIDICDQLGGVFRSIQAVIERDFLAARRDLEKDLAPIRKRLDELELEHRQLETQEQQMMAAIGPAVSKVDGEKAGRADWLQRLEQHHQNLVRRLFGG